jgi:D-alanine-D-alanine ligase
MRVAILFNAVGENAKTDELDVLEQLEAIAAVLERLGAAVMRVPCTLDLGAIAGALDRFKPDVAFNLVECLESYGRLIHVVPSMLDALGIHYTGASAESLYITSNKVLAKERIRAGGLLTPDWTGPWPPGGGTPLVKKRGSRRRSRHIVKAVWEHASFGMDDDVIVENADEARLVARMEELAPRLRGECFAEAFVEGREFNVSILSTAKGPRALPVAEILFLDFPKGKPRIVNYKAKWEEEAIEYRGTPRTFDFKPEDRELLSELPRIARAAWDLFGLRGYARVDFRVDAKNNPFILEVNANPCISPDSGFIAAAQQGGLDYDAAIKAILDDAMRRARGAAAPRVMKGAAPQ